MKQRIRLTESQLNKVVKKCIYEYLDKMASDAMRSLGSESVPSQLSKDTYRSLRRDSRNPQKGITGIQKNSWLIHLTNYDSAVNIMKNGFKSNVKDLNFRATQDIEDETQLPNDGNGLCFAFEIDNMRWLKMVEDDFGWESDDWGAVIFQANGFNTFSSFGDIAEVVFRTNSAHNFFLLKPMDENEISKYLQYHPEKEQYFDKGIKIIDKNGRVVFYGDINDFMAKPIFEPGHGYKHSPSKLETFFRNNY